MSEFRRELERLLNRYSSETDSQSPDFYMAMYLRDCFAAFNRAVVFRDQWYGLHIEPPGNTLPHRGKGTP
jgi:hypothetical protein